MRPTTRLPTHLAIVCGVLLSLLGAGGSQSEAARAATSPDYAVALQSWRFATVGCANVEAVWRVENRGPATVDSGQAIFSLNTAGLTFMTSEVPPTCVGPESFGPFWSFTIPPLASGGSQLITTRFHADSAFAVQMHVQVPGAPAVIDANSADNDALLFTIPQSSPPPAPSPTPGPATGSFPAPTLAARQAVASLITRPNGCRSAPGGIERFVTWSGLYGGTAWTVTYPGGSVVDAFPFDEGFPPGTSHALFRMWAPGIDPASALRAEFDVVVRDTQPPVIVRPTAAVLIRTTSKQGAKVVLPRVQASDNCGRVTLTSQPRSGSRFPLGKTRVTVTATDRYGNQTSTTLFVTVRRRPTS